jgi:phage FluMu protein Com
MPFPAWFIKLTFLGPIFVMLSYPFLSRLTVSCPRCKTRLEWVDSGNGDLQNATAKCPTCNEVYDLGMSFSD